MVVSRSKWSGPDGCYKCGLIDILMLWIHFSMLFAGAKSPGLKYAAMVDWCLQWDLHQAAKALIDENEGAIKNLRKKHLIYYIIISASSTNKILM